jgi:uncharacterized protein YxeA
MILMITIIIFILILMVMVGLIMISCFTHKSISIYRGCDNISNDDNYHNHDSNDDKKFDRDKL